MSDKDIKEQPEALIAPEPSNVSKQTGGGNPPPPPLTKEKEHYEIGKVDVNELSVNVEQAVIVTTEDKLRLQLLLYGNKLKKSEGWIAPFGIFLTILLTLLTTEFKTFIFEPIVWHTIFVLACIISFIWLLFSSYNSFGTKNALEDFIKSLKNKQK